MSKISNNIRFLRTSRALTQEQFADELNVSRSRIGSYEEGRSEPPIDMLITLSDYFKLPIDVLVKNDLSKSNNSSFIEVANHRVLFPVCVDEHNENLIELIPIKASAGYLNGYSDPEYIEQLQKFKLPFIPSGKHRAFPIKGDSMLPINEGSYVVGKFVERLSEIKNGRTYVLLTQNDGIVYKRLYGKEEDSGTFLLMSDNKTYKPYELSASEILEAWEFTCCIRTQEYDEDELKIDGILKMLRELQIELQDFKRK